MGLLRSWVVTQWSRKPTDLINADDINCDVTNVHTFVGFMERGTQNM